MIQTRYPRPCPIPGHPQDDGDEPDLVTESAWFRLRAWHLQAPAERLPLPVVLTAWPSAWILHAAHVPGHVVTYAAVAAAVACWLTWYRYERSSEHERLLPTEAALVAAAIGGWMAAAVTWGPLGWPGHLLTWIYLAGAAGGYWWLRRHQAVQAARKRREDAAAWMARKADWHATAHLIGLGDFHLQKVTPTLLGEELLLTSAPGSDLASRIARNADAIADDAPAPGRPALRAGGHQHHRLPRAAGHRHPPPRTRPRQRHRVPPAHHPVAGRAFTSSLSPEQGKAYRQTSTRSG